MRLVPTLWLGPRRLVRRPVESAILFLAITLGTLGTVTAVDATVKLLKTTAENAAAPELLRLSVYANADFPRVAVFPQSVWHQAINRYNQFPPGALWLDRAIPLLPPLETAYARYASWAKVRTSAMGSWLDAPKSLCADSRVFALAGCELVTGRAFTAEEWQSGTRVVVIGTALLEKLFPEISPTQALGRTLDVNPISSEDRNEAVTIIGVCRNRAGAQVGAEGSPDDWLVLTKLPEIRPQWGRGLEFVFQARTAAEVPALWGSLRALLDQDPVLKEQTLDSPYENYRQLAVVYTGIEVLILAVGGGTLLIALWTLGSVFRSRMPSMRRSLHLLRALGADRRTLVFLGLSEILPVAVGGLVVGVAAALATRHLVNPQLWFTPQDPWVLGGLGAFAIGFQIYQVVPALAHAESTPSSGGSR